MRPPDAKRRARSRRSTDLLVQLEEDNPMQNDEVREKIKDACWTVTVMGYYAMQNGGVRERDRVHPGIGAHRSVHVSGRRGRRF